MEIKYKIIEVNPDEHQIVVRYYTDALPEEALASQVDDQGNMVRCRTDVPLTLPIPAVDGEALRTLIHRACPTPFFALKEAVADPAIDTSMTEILSLQGVEASFTYSPTTPVKSAPPVAEFVPFVP